MASANDDYSGDTSTTGTITIGSTAHGVLEVPYDTDWFKTTLVAGTTYQFSLSTSGATPSLQMYSVANGYAPLQDVAAGIVFWYKPTVSGSYYLDVGNSNTIGSYSIKASAVATDDYSDVATGATTLALGGQVSGRIELAGDRDAFKVTLEAGVTYTLSASGAADASGVSALPVVGFYSASSSGVGTPYHVNSFSDAAITSFTPTVSGVYYAVASDLDPVHGSGGYTVQLNAAADDYTANASGAGTVTVGGAAVNGTLNVAQDIDWFKVTLQASQSYAITLGDPSNHANISIVDAQGTVLSYSSYPYIQAGVGETLYFTPPRAGDYYVQVQGSNYSYPAAVLTGPYTVQVGLTPADDFSADTGTVGLLSQGQTLAGKIETPGDIDWIKVHLQAGSNYVFDLPNGTLPDGSAAPITDFRLLDATGATVQYPYTVQNSNGTTGEKTIAYLAGSSGDYYLTVSGLPFASYSVTSYPTVPDSVAGDASTTATLAPGGVVRSAIDAVADHDWYKVSIAANQNYTFELDGAYTHSGSLGAGNSGTTELKLFDSTGKVVMSTSGSNYYEATLYTYGLSAGDYYVDVSSNGTGTGSYVLREGGPSAGMVDTLPPVLTSVSGPTTAGGLIANIVLNFNDTVHLGSGTINLSTAAGKLVESFDVATSSHLTASGNSLSIDPTANLLPDTDYVLTVSAGSVADALGNTDYATATQTFHTVLAPVQLTGGSGNDIFYSTSGGGSFDGGAGTDTLVLSGMSYSRNITQGTLATTIFNYSTGELDTLTSVERLRFDNTDIAFDVRGVAGEVYRLYQAAFGRAPDLSGLGYWIAQADKGLSLHDVADGFVKSAEFTKLYGSAPTDLAFLTNLYQNVLHRAPDQPGLDYWSGQLAHGMAHADVLTGFSESAENQVALFPAMQSGIQFTHYLM